MEHLYLLESAPQLKRWSCTRVGFVKLKRCRPPPQSKWSAVEDLSSAPETVAAIVPTVVVVAAAPQNRDQKIRV
jgi:hypothetical protein